MDIERIIVKLSADVSAYNRVMARAEARVLTFANRVTGAGLAIQLPFFAAAGAITAVTGAMAAATFEALRLASSYEQIGVALEVMTGSAETAKRLMTDITNLAIETPFKTMGLIAGAKQLAAFGTEIDQIIPTLRVLGNVASGVNTGNLDQMMGRIILAFGQVRTAGKLRGSELRQFTEAGIPMPRMLAQIMGVHESSIQGLVQKGKIGFPEVVAAFNKMNQAGGTFFQMMEKQSQTLAGRWSAFIESIQLGLMRLGTSFAKSFGITQLLDSWVKALSGQDPAKIDAYFQRLSDNVNEAWTAIKGGYAVVREIAIQFYEWVKGIIEVIRQNEKLVNVLKLVVAAIIMVKVALMAYTAVIAILAGVKLAILALLSPFALAVAAVAGLLLALQQIGALDTMIETMARGWKSFAETAKAAWKGITDAIKKGDMELAGKIGFKALEVGWRTLVQTMKGVWHDFTYGILELLLQIPLQLGLLAIDAIEQVQMVFDPRNNDVIRQKWNAEREKVIGSHAEAVRGVHQLRDARKAGLIENDPQLNQLKRDLEALVLQAAQGTPEFEAAALQERKNTINAIMDAMQGALVRQVNEALHRFKDPANWSAAQLAVAGSVGGMRNVMLQNTIGPGFWERLVGSVPGGGGGLDVAQITGPLSVSSAAMEMFRDTERELEKTGGIGAYSRFVERQRTIQEATFGRPGMGAVGGAAAMGLGKLIGPMSMEMHDFALFEEYEKLRKNVQTRTDRLPPLAYQGSQEAQEAINRAQMQQVSIQEQIRNTLEAARMDEAEQKEYMRQVVEQLRLINAAEGNDPNGMVGGGGDF